MKEFFIPDDSPSLTQISYFHPYDWGFIHLLRRPAGSSKPKLVSANGFRGAFPVAALKEFAWWPEEEKTNLLGQLDTDAYASINTLYSANGNPKAKSYTRLNAAWVDCDYGHDAGDLDDKEAVALVKDLEAREVLPPIALFEHTGRGLRMYWLLWEPVREWEIRRIEHTRWQTSPFYQALLDGRPELALKKTDMTRWPPHAHDGNGFLLSRINRSLAARVQAECPQLKPDFSATPVTTHQRISGSLNSKAGARVLYIVRTPKPGHDPATYTLDELRQLCGLASENRNSRISTRGTTSGKKVSKRAQARVKRFSLLWDDFQLLRKARRGFGEGERNWACCLAATILHGMGIAKDEILHEVEDLARDCRPPFELYEAKAAFQTGVAARRAPRNQTLAVYLGVSVEEADRLGLKHIRPDYEPRREFLRTGARKEERVKRLAFLQQLANQHGNPLPFSQRDLVELIQRSGMPVSKGTVQKDLKRLSLSTNKPGRRVGATKQSEPA